MTEHGAPDVVLGSESISGHRLDAPRASSATVAFITGGSRGIGLETARELGRLGIIAIIGSRDQRRGKAAVGLLETAGVAAMYLKCDVTLQGDRRAAFDFFDQNYGKLDILINNAGVWTDSESASHETPNRTSVVSSEKLRSAFEANFFSVVFLTQTLLPLIRKAPAGRIVNVSAELGSLTLHADPQSVIYGLKPFAYAASKTALNAFTIHLAHELRDTPIKVNSVHPGWVRTEMGGSKATLDSAEGSRTSVRFATLPADGPTGGYFHLDKPLPW